MKFKIGDKVKFLNEQGGGFITKIETPSLVYVKTSDGFDIPFSTTELIKIEVKTASANFFDEDFGNHEKLSEDEIQEMEADAKIEPLAHKRSDMLKEGISLAFVPQNQNRTLFGLIDVVLINNSPFNVLFAFFLKYEDKFQGQDYDAIEPFSTFLLDSIDRDELANWIEGNVQAMFFASTMDKLISPVNEFFKIKGSKLYHENNYKTIDVLEKKAFVHQLNDLKYQTLISKTEETANTQSTMLGRDIEQALGIKKSLIEKHKIGLLEAEIDLHISALDPDYQNLEKNEIMKIQLDYFEKTLEDAMIHQYQKLIYIHGIGNGILKNELRRILRSYPDIQVKEAAFSNYGYGAIEVHIHYR
ncbi:MAG: hypothetical protein DRI74_02540 [Bacteroidetes bacterium]|nr:MAG: hypothetical protein DRI74_02540 [Bacteroidota bacterium]